MGGAPYPTQAGIQPKRKGKGGNSRFVASLIFGFLIIGILAFGGKVLWGLLDEKGLDPTLSDSNNPVNTQVSQNDSKGEPAEFKEVEVAADEVAIPLEELITEPVAKPVTATVPEIITETVTEPVIEAPTEPLGYRGGLKNGLEDGFGINVTDYGTRYEGEWKEGMHNGQGTYTWPGGEYSGEFKNHMYRGLGTLTLVDGSVYVGEFRGHMKNGQGTLIKADGTVLSGTWVNNEFIE